MGAQWRPTDRGRWGAAHPDEWGRKMKIHFYKFTDKCRFNHVCVCSPLPTIVLAIKKKVLSTIKMKENSVNVKRCEKIKTFFIF